MYNTVLVPTTKQSDSMFPTLQNNHQNKSRWHLSLHSYYKIIDYIPSDSSIVYLEDYNS